MITQIEFEQAMQLDKYAYLDNMIETAGEKERQVLVDIISISPCETQTYGLLYSKYVHDESPDSDAIKERYYNIIFRHTKDDLTNDIIEMVATNRFTNANELLSLINDRNCYTSLRHINENLTEYLKRKPPISKALKRLQKRCERYLTDISILDQYYTPHFKCGKLLTVDELAQIAYTQNETFSDALLDKDFQKVSHYLLNIFQHKKSGWISLFTMIYLYIEANLKDGDRDYLMKLHVFITQTGTLYAGAYNL